MFLYEWPPPVRHEGCNPGRPPARIRYVFRYRSATDSDIASRRPACRTSCHLAIQSCECDIRFALRVKANNRSARLTIPTTFSLETIGIRFTR